PGQQNAKGYPVSTGNKKLEDRPGQIKVNGIKGLLAKRTTSAEDFAGQAGISENKLKRVNDLKKNDKIVAGRYYYTKRKKGKAQVEEHVVGQGETLWEISQLYGIRLNSLKAKNRIYKDADLRPGMVLKLKDYRKRNEEIRMVAPPTVQTATAQKVIRATQPVQPSTPQPSPARSGTYTPPASSTSKDVSHHVKAGETLYAISRMYQVSVDELRRWNNLNQESILSIGQVIVIRK